jgi:hypothetical protein
VDGDSLWDTLLQGKSLAQRVRFWEWRFEGAHQLAAMRGNNKLVITSKGPPELFDIAQDPQERINLFAERPEEGRNLLRLLMEWIATETEASKEGKKSD